MTVYHLSAKTISTKIVWISFRGLSANNSSVNKIFKVVWQVLVVKIGCKNCLKQFKRFQCQILYIGKIFQRSIRGLIVNNSVGNVFKVTTSRDLVLQS